MTTFIEAKKAEAKEEFKKTALYKKLELAHELIEMEHFTDALLESFLSEIEGRVVPEIDVPYAKQDELDLARLVGFKECREETIRNFQHLRTGGTE